MSCTCYLEGKEPMRRFIAMLGLGCLAVGCQHVGGKCDCGPQPGDAAMYAPFNREAAALSRNYEPIPSPRPVEPKNTPVNPGL